MRRAARDARRALGSVGRPCPQRPKADGRGGLPGYLPTWWAGLGVACLLLVAAGARAQAHDAGGSAQAAHGTPAAHGGSTVAHDAGAAAQGGNGNAAHGGPVAPALGGSAADAGPGTGDGGAGSAAAAAPPPAGGSPPAETDEGPLPAGHEPKIAVKLTPRSGVHTGDLVTLEIRATVPEGDDVEVPKQSFSPYEIHDKVAHVEDEKSGRQTFVFRLGLLAFEPGDHSVGPVKLRVVTKDGTVGAARTRALPLRIVSWLANEPNAKPKPPSKPVRVMEKDYTLAWVLGAILAALLVALATLLIARWLSRRAKALKPPPPPRPAWEVALEKLDALRRRRGRMFEEGEIVAWADGVSDALREYLGARYGFEGLESTTDEVVARLRKLRPVGITVAEVTALLGDCDLVKFAKATMDEEQADSLLAGALRIVRVTTPRSAGVAPHPGPNVGNGPGTAPRAPRESAEEAAPPPNEPPAASPGGGAP